MTTKPIYLPAELHKRIKVEAARQGIPMNRLIERMFDRPWVMDEDYQSAEVEHD